MDKPFSANLVYSKLNSTTHIFERTNGVISIFGKQKNKLWKLSLAIFIKFLEIFWEFESHFPARRFLLKTACSKNIWRADPFYKLKSIKTNLYIEKT